MARIEDVQVAARLIANALWRDSRVDIDVHELAEILLGDITAFGSPVPNGEECELLVTGDDDGEVPEELKSRYPDTCSLSMSNSNVRTARIRDAAARLYSTLQLDVELDLEKVLRPETPCVVNRDTR